MNWLLPLLALSVLTSAEQLVRVRSHVVVPPGSQVLLSQLLDTSGMSDSFKSSINEIVLATAPAPGEKMELTNVALTALLRPAIAAEKENAKTNVRLLVPSRVVIDTVKRSMVPEDVRRELLQAWRPLCAPCDLEIHNLSVPRVENIVDWNLKLRSEMPRGTFSIPIEIVRENGSLLPAWVNGQVHIHRPVPVAKRMINAGERIQAADVAIEKVNVTYATDGIPSVADLVGKKLRQAVRVNEPLWSRWIEPEKAVRRGELVRASTSDGSWEVSMQMVAEQDAVIGEKISLKHPRTNKILTGLVVAQGEVEIK